MKRNIQRNVYIPMHSCLTRSPPPTNLKITGARGSLVAFLYAKNALAHQSVTTKQATAIEIRQAAS